MQHVQHMATQIGLIARLAMGVVGHAIPQMHIRLLGHPSTYKGAGVDAQVIVVIVPEIASQYHLRVVVIQ
jgi:flagellar biosynthesis protein FliR